MPNWIKQAAWILGFAVVVIVGLPLVVTIVRLGTSYVNSLSAATSVGQGQDGVVYMMPNGQPMQQQGQWQQGSQMQNGQCSEEWYRRSCPQQPQQHLQCQPQVVVVQQPAAVCRQPAPQYYCPQPKQQCCNPFSFIFNFMGGGAPVAQFRSFGGVYSGGSSYCPPQGSYCPPRVPNSCDVWGTPR